MKPLWTNKGQVLLIRWTKYIIQRREDKRREDKRREEWKLCAVADEGEQGILTGQYAAHVRFNFSLPLLYCPLCEALVLPFFSSLTPVPPRLTYTHTKVHKHSLPLPSLICLIWASQAFLQCDTSQQKTADLVQSLSDPSALLSKLETVNPTLYMGDLNTELAFRLGK